MGVIDLILPPLTKTTTRLSWASTTTTASDDSASAPPSRRTYDTYSAALAALARPERKSDEAALRAIVDGYVNVKLAHSADVKKAGRKLDQIERHLLHVKIPALPRAIARSRALHGIPITDVNLPSSWAAFEQGVEIKGHSNSILVFKL